MNPWTSETATLGAPVLWSFDFVLHASPQDLWPILLDTTRINDLGWYPTIKLRDGVASTYDWYVENLT